MINSEQEKKIKDNDIINNLAPALTQFGKVLKKLNDSLSPKFSAVVTKVANIFASFPFDTFYKWATVFSDINYISLLKRLKLPLFLVNDEKLKDDILSACAEKDNFVKATEIAITYCNKSFIEQLGQEWSNSTVVKEERKDILQEALLLHNEKRYYASTSILMCQVYGLASDISAIATKKGLRHDEESKAMVAEHFNIKQEDIDKEKGTLLQMATIPEQGAVVWLMIAEYLKEEILCSSASKKRWATQPVRNKICHGAQLNFNTEEHSLKAILTADILIQLANILNDMQLDEKS